MNPLISIIVPVYNIEKYIDCCVRSLVKQTYENLEIILINDGSTDASLSLCRDWEEKDSRITVIDQRNQGASVARNSGIRACSGEWICFVDGDDWLEGDAIEKMLENVGAETEVLITDYYINSETKSWKESFFSLSDHDFSREEHIELIKNCFLKTSFSNRRAVTMVGVPWAKLIRADLIKKNHISFDPDLRKMQDALFCSEVFHFSSNIRFRAVPVYHYRQNSTSITHRGNPKYQKIADSVLRAFRKFIKKYHYEAQLKDVYYAKKFMFAFETVKFVYILDDTGLKVPAKIRGVKKIMSELKLHGHEKDILPYLGNDYKVAYVLYQWKAYALMYGMETVYYKVKMYRRG